MAAVLYKDDVIHNNNYRRVAYTDKYQQKVLMALKPGEVIGWEAHEKATQTVEVYEGKGLALTREETGGEEAVTVLIPGTSITIPPGTQHDFRAGEYSSLRILVIYSPPQHEANLIQVQKPQTKERERGTYARHAQPRTHTRES